MVIVEKELTRHSHRPILLLGFHKALRRPVLVPFLGNHFHYNAFELGSTRFRRQADVKVIVVSSGQPAIDRLAGTVGMRFRLLGFHRDKPDDLHQAALTHFLATRGQIT